MKPKRLIPLFCLAAGVLLCIFLARLASVGKFALSQVFLFYGALALLNSALLTHTILKREDNDTSLHYTYKIFIEVLIYFALVIFMLCDIFLV